MNRSSAKRISSYGVAVAAVLGSTSARADVIFVDVNPDATGSTTTTNPAVLLSFSLTGVVATDGSHVLGEQFFANHTYGHIGSSSTSPIGSKLNFQGNGVTAVDPAPLAYGTLIGSGEASDPSVTNGFVTLTGNLKGPRGDWTPGQEAYLGLRFDNGGTPNYGWADITANSATSITLHSFAYDNTGGPIAAGVPEPSQIALFAAGAAGITIYRRRKQQTTTAS